MRATALALARQAGHRDISPFLQKFRNLLQGREANINPRFKDEMATRDPPEANLPPGPAHKVSGNYYFTRDGRREVTFPTTLADSTKALQAGGEGKEEASSAVANAPAKRRTPGPVYKYSQ